MNLSADPIASSDDHPVQPTAQWAFWLVAALGTVVLCLAWVWYGLAFSEEMSEQCKALAADNTMQGTGLLFGGVPLVLAHLLVLIPLLAIGSRTHSTRARGIMRAIVATAVASGIGIAVSELLWSGSLFTMSAAHAGCS